MLSPFKIQRRNYINSYLKEHDNIIVFLLRNVKLLTRTYPYIYTNIFSYVLSFIPKINFTNPLKNFGTFLTTIVIPIPSSCK